MSTITDTKRTTLGYLGKALKVTLGAGAALGGSYLFSRIRDKHDAETSLNRLEQMVEEVLAAGGDAEK